MLQITLVIRSWKLKLIYVLSISRSYQETKIKRAFRLNKASYHNQNYLYNEKNYENFTD